MTSDDSAEQRDRDARQRLDLLAGASGYESARAAKLIEAFMEKVRVAGPPAVPLRARTLDGHAVKTDKQGWYIRNDHSVAVGTDGQYYQLTVPGGWQARLKGVRLRPTPPPLVVGRGGKDGETGDLKDFLDRTLAGQVRP